MSDRIFDYVRSQSPKGSSRGSAWIQWKGSSVCADITCICGADGHVDAQFAYFVRCPDCDRVYALDPNINLVEIPSDEFADDIAAINDSVIHKIS